MMDKAMRPTNALSNIIRILVVYGFVSLPSYAAEPHELDAIQVESKEESASEIGIDKLLKVPGSGNDPLRAISSLPGVTFGSGARAAPAVRGSSPADNR